MAGGQFDANVKNEAQYSIFQEFMQNTLSVQGGSTPLAITILNNPQDYSTYARWKQTSLENPNVTGFQTTELWTLMRNAASSVVRGRANDIQAAFNYIVSHPQVHETAVTLTIQSDWGEFGLLTPSAMIFPGTPFPRTTFSETKVTFGERLGRDYQRVAIQ